MYVVGTAIVSVAIVSVAIVSLAIVSLAKVSQPYSEQHLDEDIVAIYEEQQVVRSHAWLGLELG